MERNDRTVLIVGVLVLVLLVIGYYFLLLGPKREEYSQRVQERESRESQLAQLQGQVAELEEVRDRSPEIERQLLELSKRIPDQPEIPTLVAQIQEIARGSGVTQMAISPGTPEAPPGDGDFQRIPVTMSFEGTYLQMQDFLRRSRNLVRLMTVNEVTYDVAEQEGETTAVEPGIERQVQVEIVAEVYIQPSSAPTQQQAPAAPAPPETTTPEGTVGAVPRVDRGG